MLEYNKGKCADKAERSRVMVIRTQYLERLRPFYDSELVKVITGIRRCGKSTILRQVIAEIKKNGIEDSHIVYINFEDYKYHKLTDADAFYEYVDQKIVDESKYYLFFDEIQNVNNFELVVNSFRATHNVSIFITGSNSKLLSGELATHLSGRTVSLRVLPFNFMEFCQYKDISAPDYETLLAEYMTYGGLPLVCGAANKETKEVILNNIYDAVVLKDIVMRNKINSPLVLEKVLDYIVGNSSLTVSGNAIAGTLSSNGHKVSAPVVYDYLRCIVDACVCDKVSRYDIRGKKALAFEEKYYVCDLGFLHLKKNRIKDEYNYIIETICYNELISRGYKVYVGKTWKGEIDFIAELNGKIIYIQAAYLLDDIFRNAQAAYNHWSKLPPAERTVQNLLENLSYDFFNLLDSVTIARSRKHITRYYDTKAIGSFPERKTPLSFRPALVKNGAVNYKEIFSKLDELELSIYTPTEFILHSRLPKYAELFDDNKVNTGFTQANRERGIRRLMAINILKRMESSVYSFRLTVERVRASICAALQKIDSFTQHRLANAQVDTGTDFSGADFDMEEESFVVGKKSAY